jgi:hypothetical protein
VLEFWGIILLSPIFFTKKYSEKMNRKTKKIRKWHVSFIVFALLICCQNSKDDNDYFNGEIREFNDMDNVQNITLNKIELDGPYFGWLVAYDSLIIFRNIKLPDYHFNIFNLNTGQELGNYCRRGIGPDDLNDVGLIYNLFSENGDLKAWLFTGPEEELVKWNISKSIQTGETAFDTIVPYKWQKENNFASYNYIFSLDENTIMAYVQATSTAPNEKGITVPFYQKRSIFDNKLFHRYDIFNRPIYNTKIKSTSDFFFSSSDYIKPDGSKIVQVMHYLCQINIIDIYTGQVLGFRMKHTPGFSLFKTSMENFKIYHLRVQADNDFIYATYWGKPQWNAFSEFPMVNTIHIFDWNGNIVKKLIVDHPINEFWLDQATNKLYTLDMSSDELYVCDLNQLNLK